MHTFVISLCDEISHFGIVEPFIYRLQREGMVEFISTTGSVTQKVEHGCRKVMGLLSNSTITHWQVIFLNKVEVSGDSIAKSSITAKVRLIEELFFKRLERFRAVSNTFIISLDELKEHNDYNFKKPTDFYNDCWELDLGGAPMTGDRFYMNKEGVKALDEVWQKHEAIYKEQRVSKYTELDADTKEKVDLAFEELTHEAVKLLIFDEQERDRYFIDDDGVIPFLKEEGLALMKNDLLEHLAVVKNKPSSYVDLNPSYMVESLIKRHVGLFSENFSNRYLHFRFPYYADHYDVVNVNYLKLILFIHFLILDHERFQEDFSDDYIYVVEMRLEMADLKRLLMAGRDAMIDQRGWTNSALKSTQQIKVEQLELVGCDCKEELEAITFSSPRYGVIKEEDSLFRWNKWNKDCQQKLLDLRNESSQKIAKCIDKNRKYEQPKQMVDHQSDQVSKAYHDLKADFEVAQEELNNYFQVTSNATVDVAPSLTERIERALDQRPEKNIALGVIGGAIVLLISPYLVSYDYAPAGIDSIMLYLLILWIAGILSVLVMGILARKRLMEPIKACVNEQYEKYRVSKNTIIGDFEKQLQYQAKKCLLSIKKENLEKLKEALQQVNSKKLMLEYHHLKLDNSIQGANRFFQIIESVEKDASQDIQKLPLREGIDLNTSLPEHKNEVYSMLDHVPYHASSEKFRFEVQGAKREISSYYQYLLKSFVIKHDQQFHQSA